MSGLINWFAHSSTNSSTRSCRKSGQSAVQAALNKSRQRLLRPE
jgi:hypothetical protein